MRRAIPIVALAFLLGCADGGDGHSPRITDPFEPNYVTQGGVPVEAGDEAREDEHFEQAMAELDAVLAAFRIGLKPYKVEVRGVRIAHAHSAEEATLMRARYMGGGLIEACIHTDRRPLMFCLPGALLQAADAQNPEGVSQWSRNNAVQLARVALMRLYPNNSAEAALTID